MIDLKKTVFAILAICLVLTAVSCGSAAAPEGMVALSGENLTYNVYVPKTWTASLSGGAVSAYAEDMSNVSVQTSPVPKNTEGDKELYADINDLWENGYKVSLGYTFSQIEYAETAETTLGGEKALKAEYKVKVFDISAKAEKEYSIMQIITRKESDYYILTYTAETANYKLHTEEVNSIISTFSFK